MNELDKFYYNILNIKKTNVTLDLIIKIVREKTSEIYKRTSDISGLCKVVADVLLNEFNKFNINTLLFDIKDLCNINYSHEFLIVYFEQDSHLNYVLIDPTYIQFVKKDGKLNPKFRNYPSEILKETEKGKKLLKFLFRLLTKWYIQNEYITFFVMFFIK